VMDEAVANHSVLSQHLLGDGIEETGAFGDRARAEVGRRIQAEKPREFDTLGIVLGYRYRESPVILSDGSQPPQQHFKDYVPSTHPGCRAPHAWLADGASLFDHFGKGFTLMASRDAEVSAFEDAARVSGIPLTVMPHPDNAVAELYPTRYTLIRPDQHVAWRGNEGNAAVAALGGVAGFGRAR
jgi:hypothetical protein